MSTTWASLFSAVGRDRRDNNEPRRLDAAARWVECVSCFDWRLGRSTKTKQNKTTNALQCINKPPTAGPAQSRVALSSPPRCSFAQFDLFSFTAHFRQILRNRFNKLMARNDEAEEEKDLKEQKSYRNGFPLSSSSSSSREVAIITIPPLTHLPSVSWNARNLFQSYYDTKMSIYIYIL